MTEAAATKPLPTRAELYRALALATGGLTILLLWQRHPMTPVAWVLAATLLPLAGLLWRWTWAPAGMVAIYLLSDGRGFSAFSGGFSSSYSWIEASLLAYVAAHFRYIAATESVGRERVSLWQLARQPVKFSEMFRRSREPQSSPPADAHEIFRFVALAPITVAIAMWIVYYAPYQTVESWRVAAGPRQADLLTMFLILAVPAMLIRSILHAIGRRRVDPVAAELELNETVWRELRPELTGIGRALGKASAREIRSAE